jgi:hypothetical protein
VGSEIPRDADLRDYGDEDERDQGDKQSDGARAGADRRKGEGQKQQTKTRRYPRDDR